MNIILEGEVLVQDIDLNGNVLTINKFHSKDVFGENLLFSNYNNYPMTILSKTNSTILHIKKDLILQFCQHNIQFLNNILLSVSNKKDKVKKLSMKSIRECIVHFLISESKLQNNNTIILNKTKKELAEEFKIQRTSLSRELNKMKNDNLIEFDSKTITILDFDVLFDIINK